MELDFEQKHLIIGAGILLLTGALAFSSLVDTGLESQDDGSDVVATFYPLYTISEEVAGEEASVSSLVPPGTDPHSFEPSPQDIQRLNNADIFVVTGAEFEEWEHNLIESVDDDVRIVKPSDSIELIEIDDSHGEEHHEEHHEEENHGNETHEEDTHHGEEEHHEEHHDEHHGEGDHEGHDHGPYDPHYWLSPTNAEVIAEEVSQALQSEDPENSEAYESNFEAFRSELQALDSDFREGLQGCELDTILVTHAAFSYLGEEYGFSQVQITGLGHLTEPTAQELENLQNQASEHGIEHIFYDSMVDSSVADTIAGGVDAEVMVLNSIEGAKEEPYIDLMRENLDNLEIALQCR